MTASIQVPAGILNNVLKIKETTPLETNAVEFKHYARGIGLIKAKGVVLPQNIRDEMYDQYKLYSAEAVSFLWSA